MKRKGKKRMWIALAVVGVIVVVLGVGLIVTGPGRAEAMNLTYDADFAHLRDGVYSGEYKGAKDNFRNNKVQVTVEGGRVTAIKVTEGPLAKDKPVELRDGKTIDDLFGEVIEEQSLQVDVISGATITSKVHLKAVENALEQAKE